MRHPEHQMALIASDCAPSREHELLVWLGTVPDGNWQPEAVLLTVTAQESPGIADKAKVVAVAAPAKSAAKKKPPPPVRKGASKRSLALQADQVNHPVFWTELARHALSSFFCWTHTGYTWSGAQIWDTS